MKRNSVLIVLAILACNQLLGACTYQAVSTSPDAIRASISSGDTVRITTQSGQEDTFRVTEVGSDGLSGANEEVAYEEIARLEKRETNQPVLWVVLGLAAAGLAGGGGGGSY